jgi:hypothetical protein
VPVRHLRTTRPIRPQRRRLEWADSLITFNAIATNTLQTTDLLANFVADGGSREGVTVIRTHIQCAYAPASVGGRSTIGLIVSSLQASTITGELNPLNDPYEPWLLVKTLYPGASGATVNATNPFEIDVKSKRKVQHIQETYWLSWISTDTGTASFNAHVRALIALP